MNPGLTLTPVSGFYRAAMSTHTLRSGWLVCLALTAFAVGTDDLVREPDCAEAVALYEQRLQAVRERIDALTATERRLEDHLADHHPTERAQA